MAFDADSVKLGRRGLLAGGGALGLTGVLAACGNGDDENPDTAASGPWSFTDDRGETVELDAVPTKIVAFTGMAAALYDFGIEIPAVYGPTTNEDGSPTTQAGNLPVADLEVFGNVYGEFDVEAYAAYGPEVMMTHYYIDPASLWYVPAESTENITSLAPVVAISANDEALSNTLDDVIGRHAAIAESLGADLDSDTNAANKERYDAAVEALKAAAAANPVKVLACAAAADTFYASSPLMGNDTRFFMELGVDIIVPDALDEATGSYFEFLSWENVDKYQADVLLLDNRVQSLQPDQLADYPTFQALPAVQEGQIVGWEAEPMYSYGLAAASIEALAEAIQNAKKLF